MKNSFSPFAALAAVAMLAGGLLAVGNNYALADIAAPTFTSFGFENPATTGVIDNGAMTVTITVPRGTDVTAMNPIFDTSAEASVWANDALQYSGDASVDFTDSVVYTVSCPLLARAETGLVMAVACPSSTYTVTVRLAAVRRSAPKEVLLPAEVSNIPMSISGDQEGTATYDLENGIRVKLSIMSGTLDNAATNGGGTFNVRYGTMQDAISNIYIEVSAVDGFGNQIHSLLKKIAVSISGLALPPDLSPLYVSYFDEAGNSWTEIPGATFDAATGTATFEVDHLTRFAAFDRSTYAFRVLPPVEEETVLPPAPASEPVVGEVLGNVVYADGTLLRGPDMRIYVLVNGKLQYIPTLAELAKHYFGKEIINVTDAVLDMYR